MKKQSSPKIYGLVGYPVKHSFSPAMHNAAFRALKINAEYRIFEVPPAKLNRFLEELPDKIAGCNVTIPHKIAAYDFISKNGDLTEEANKIGAVNTITVKNFRLMGDNTDGKGFMASLEKDLSFDPTDKTICVVGAGGVARSIIMQLGNHPKKIYAFGIIKQQLKELKRNYKKYYDKKKIECHIARNKKSRTSFVRKSDLFINATPVGMEHMKGCVIEKDALHDNLVVYDVIYNPLETKLLSLTKEKGIQYYNGLGMLLYQGMLSFKIWTGKDAPQEVMWQAIQGESKKCIT